jgi:putative DNA primase/helicase
MSEAYLKINSMMREQREHSECSTHCMTSSNNTPADRAGNSGDNTTSVVGAEEVGPPFPIIQAIYLGIECYTDRFEYNDKKFDPGLYWHDVTKGDEAIKIWIANPIIIDAITSNLDGHEFGRLLRFLDSNGKWHRWSMPMRMLKSNGEDVLEVLLDQGFVYKKSKRAQLLDYIMMFKPGAKMKATSKIGWHGETFVLPNKIIGCEEIIFQSDSLIDNDFHSNGTLEEWKDNIGILCQDNKLLIASVAIALAGVLFKQLNKNQGGGIHMVGDSSSGKSTCMEVAASVWGPSHFMRSWSVTANGLEGIAATRNDTCLILDEIDEASPQEISKIVYMLSNGQGKQRANKNGFAKPIQRWRTMALSSGERSLSNILNEINKQPNSGQLVRLINIDANFKYGVFESLHEFENGRELSDHLKSSRNKYYGVIGPKFVECLIKDNSSEILDVYEEIRSAFKPLATNGLELRAASSLEIIALAGELGIKYGLLPWVQGSAVVSLIEVFNRWKNNEDSGSTEDDKIINSVTNFIDKYSDSRFTDKSSSYLKTTGIRAGWYVDTEKGRTYMIFSHALKEAGGNYSVVRIAQALKRKRAIVDHDTDRLLKSTRVGGELKKLYHIRMPNEISL